jgi:hypothetical protein
MTCSFATPSLANECHNPATRFGAMPCGSGTPLELALKIKLTPLMQ